MINIKLKPCPMCGGKVCWCADTYDIPHECDQIVCPECEFNFNVENKITLTTNDMKTCQLETARIWNRRNN